MSTAIMAITKKNSKEKTQIFGSANPNAAESDIALAMASLNNLTTRKLKNVKKLNAADIDISAYQEDD